MTIEGHPLDAVDVAADIVERIWARDASLWTGGDEGNWLGWLDEPVRMIERLDELNVFADEAHEEFGEYVLLGMGGSSLGPKVIAETFRNTPEPELVPIKVEPFGDAIGKRITEGSKYKPKRRKRASPARQKPKPGPFSVLDTTHPKTIMDFARYADLDRTLFVVSSKSGTTLETRCHLDYFWELTGGRGEQFVAVTDPGSELEVLARERGFRHVFSGEPTIGGRYSVLSVFGLVPSALMGVNLPRFLDGAIRMAEACKQPDGPGVELGLRLARNWQAGRDKVCLDKTRGDFGLWAEQLLAESTGKEGKGLIPAPEEDPDGGPDRQPGEIQLQVGFDLADEFYRWEFATAVAGAVMGINPFDQPNVQEAKDRTEALLESGQEPTLDPEDTVEGLLAQAEPGDYVCIQAFVDPHDVLPLTRLHERVRRATRCVVTMGYGPRYLHSTGQLHKGGPPSGLFLQVVDDEAPELEIPGKPFGFRRLLLSQAAADYEALRERGARLARVRLRDL